MAIEYRMNRHLNGFTYDTDRYEECRVVVSFPDGCDPVSDVLDALLLLAYMNHWQYVVLKKGANCRARHFMRDRKDYLRERLLGRRSKFARYWRRQQRQYISKLVY